MAALIGITEENLKQVVLTLGMSVVQSEAERIQASEAWLKDTVAENFILRKKPEIEHFRQALINLTSPE